MDNNDLVFYKGEGGNIMSMGFNIESQFPNISPMTTNNSNKIGGQVSSLFKNLAIPSGYSYNKAYGGGNKKTSTKIINNDEILSENIHDKLLNLVTVNKTNKTRKSNKTQHKNKTKKRINTKL